MMTGDGTSESCPVHVALASGFRINAHNHDCCSPGPQKHKTGYSIQNDCSDGRLWLISVEDFRIRKPLYFLGFCFHHDHDPWHCQYP